MSEPLQEKIVQILEAHNHMTIALLKPDGSPQATTVSFANKGTTLYFGSDAHANKSLFLNRDSRVSISVCKDWEDWSHVQALNISGTAERIDDLQEFEEARKLLLEKFSSLPHYKPDDPEHAVFFRIIPLTVRVLDYTQGVGHSDVYSVELT